jgi:ubiquinone/menaquinone biosynthesis C-methylase UbiE
LWQRKVEREINNVEFINTTIFDERFNKASFDMVTAFYVLHFYEDIDKVFRRIHRLLKPGGLFVSETACMAEKDVIMGKVVRIAGTLGFLPLINLLSTQQLERALHLVGFSVIDKTKYSDSNEEYTLIAKKL